MVYLMDAETYWKFIEECNMTHEELIAYLNSIMNIIGEITELHIKC